MVMPKKDAQNAAIKKDANTKKTPKIPAKPPDAGKTGSAKFKK